ncbi:MAG: YfiR family protein [Bacteroidota bacterium]
MKKLVIAPLFGLLFLSFSTTDRPEHELHAMMVYNFTKYVEWPNLNDQFTIGVLGNSKVFQTLEHWYHGRLRGGKKFEVVEYKSVDDALSCHILYYGGSSKDEFRQIKEKVKDKPTLLITNRSGFGREGSSINFKTVAGNLKFEINQKAIEAAKLRVSNQLTALAIVL